MTAFLLSITLYLIPIFMLFYMTFEVYQRNRYNPHNRIAAYFFLCTMAVYMGNFLTSLFPLQFARELVLWMVYFPAFVMMSLVLHFCCSIAGRLHSRYKALLLMLCYVPMMTGTLLFFRIPGFSVQMFQDGLWKFEVPSRGLSWLTLFFGLYTVLGCLCLVVVGFRCVNEYDWSLKKKQMRTILLGVCVASAWAIPFSIYKRPSFFPTDVNFPDLGLYGVLFFTFFLRYAMIKYDFLPSIERKYQVLYELSPLSILLIDTDGIIKDANAQAFEFMECGPKDLLLRDIRDFTGTLIMTKGNLAITTFTGKTKHVKVECESILAQHRTYQYVVLLDVTETKAAEDKVMFLAYHDPLTGLANRAYFHEQLQQAYDNEDTSFGVMLLDLDGFKQINDTQGHLVGDAILKSVGMRLKQFVPSHATIARLGGDEFAFIIPGLDHIEAVDLLGSRIVEAFKAAFIYNENCFYITASIGICLYPEHGVNAEDLLQFADIAMYQAKRRGRNCYVLYETSQHHDEQDRFLINSGVREGLQQGEFVLYYQPQVDVRSGNVIGAEALIRWVRPDVGIVPPNEFIPLAEESGIIVEIGYWVLETSCQQLTAWIKNGMYPLTMSINLSARQFLDPNFPKRLIQTLHLTGLDPALLCLEITESTAMYDSEYVMRICREIMNIGVKLSIDDFGTGYSSLALLKRLSVHTIKIDRSFVMDMLTDENDRAIIKAIIAMSHSLGKRVVAEGVEESGQFHLLSQLGCDEIQGYYVSRPLEAQDFFQFMNMKTSIPNIL
jgi:diguanylate cyclase (GGDEF)-like protein